MAMSTRAIKAVQLLGKNKGSVSKSMLEAGYSPSYARTALLKHQKNFDKLVEKFLPDISLVNTHKALLKAEKMQVFNRKRTYEPDHEVRLRAVDLAYKIKNKYPKEALDITLRPDAAKSIEELEFEIAEAKKKLGRA